MILVLALKATYQILKMKYETHAYGIEFEIKNVFKKWNEKIENHFENWF